MTPLSFFAGTTAAAAGLLFSIALSTPSAAQTPAAPSPVAAPTAPADPIAGPVRQADTVRVVVAGADNLSGEFRVESDGTVLVPRLGQISVAGKMQADAAQEIARRIEQRRLLKRADVGVYIVGRRARTVVINGSVTTQGIQVLKDGAVLSEVLENAGLSPTADLSRVAITRGTKTLTVNYKKYRNGQSDAPENNPVLEDADRVYVYSAAPVEGTVRVIGEVRDAKNAEVPITAGTTVGQLLQTVGGVTNYADRSRIYVQRGVQQLPVSYDDLLRNVPGKDFVLQDKDLLNVPRLDRPRQVTVAGAVRNPANESLTTRLTLLDAVAQAGGPQDGAQQDKVEVRRVTPSGAITTRTYNLAKDKEAATELIDGDYVFIPYGKQRPRTDAGTVVGLLSGVAVIFGALRR